MMQPRHITTLISLLACLQATPHLHADATSPSQDFNEVYELIRSNLVDLTDAELNRAALDGLLDQFSGRVVVEGAKPASDAAQSAPITRTNIYDGNVAYLRIGDVNAQLPAAVASTWSAIGRTNKLEGLIIDLRYATGGDYSAAAAVADLFTSGERPLLDWGDGSAKSRSKSDAITIRLAVLVNRQTQGAAEALAAILRETSAGLILGSRTSGTAIITKDFPLTSGQRLRIATATVKLGDGTPLSIQGLKPDIEIAMNPNSEKEYFEDAYTMIPTTNLTAAKPIPASGDTNQTARRPRLNEADLVRQHREGNGGQSGDTPRAADREPETPVIRDPALARAVDLLKGLAVVKGSRS